MPHTHGYVGNFNELVSKIIEWSTDADIYGADAWELIRNEPWPRGTILKGHPAVLLQQANEIEKLSGQMNCMVRLED